MSENARLASTNTLVDEAYQSLKKDIIEEYLPAGEKINLNTLCTRYGTSPTPIKQALNRLIAEGLIESIPRKGCRVRPFNWAWVDERFEIRMMMELYFAPQTTAAVKPARCFRPVLSKTWRKIWSWPGITPARRTTSAPTSWTGSFTSC